MPVLLKERNEIKKKKMDEGVGRQKINRRIKKEREIRKEYRNLWLIYIRVWVGGQGVGIVL